MWKEGDDPEDTLAALSSYGKNKWTASDANTVDVSEIQKDIVKVIRKAGAHSEYGSTAAQLAREANPDDIVNSAGLWDAPDLVRLINDEILEPRGITGVRTRDGLVTFGHPNIRSIDAAFDPKNKDSAKLLGGVGAFGGMNALSEDQSNRSAKTHGY